MLQLPRMGSHSDQLPASQRKGKYKGINEIQTEFPGPEQLMTLGGSIEEVTKEANLEEFMMPARSSHDMRPDCSCCRRPRSNKVKSIKRLAMRAALNVENRFKVLEESEDDHKEEIMEDDKISVQKVSIEKRRSRTMRSSRRKRTYSS